jgi:hypothetical protein
MSVGPWNCRSALPEPAVLGKLPRSRADIAHYGNRRFLEGVDNGKELGIAEGRAQVQAQAVAAKLDAVTKLINAAGQAMDAQARMMRNLADVLDNTRVM